MRLEEETLEECGQWELVKIGPIYAVRYEVPYEFTHYGFFDDYKSAKEVFTEESGLNVLGKH